MMSRCLNAQFNMNYFQLQLFLLFMFIANGKKKQRVLNKKKVVRQETKKTKFKLRDIERYCKIKCIINRLLAIGKNLVINFIHNICIYFCNSIIL